MTRQLRQPNDESPLSRRLEGFTLLDDTEQKLVERVETSPKRSFHAGSRICVEGRQFSPQLIITGWACRLTDLTDGRRQIVELLCPGDLIGLGALAYPAALANVLALTTVRTVDASDLRSALKDRQYFPRLASGLELVIAEREAFLLNQIIRLGRMTAYERMAHLLIELDYRLKQRGLSESGSFVWPLTQEMLANTLGLSAVHTNRTLQQLRREGFLELGQGRLTLRRIDTLKSVAGFHPPVLQLSDDATYD